MTIDRYSKSKIYKLIDNDGYYYFGSTCLPLHKRLYVHKQFALKKPDRKVYKIFTYKRFLDNEIKIVLVEEFELNNKEQLYKEENKYIENHIDDPFCLNANYAIFNLQRYVDYNIEYRSNHKLEKAQRSKLYREINKEKLKEAYENKKEEIQKQRSLKYTCECGTELTVHHKQRHEKSKKHIAYINNCKFHSSD